MNINELNELISTGDFSQVVAVLKNGRIKTNAAPEKWSDYQSELDPARHKVNDRILRPDTIVKTDDGTKIVKAERIALAIQKLIVKRAAAMLFGNDPALVADQQNNIVDTLTAVFDDVKISTLNYNVGKIVMSNREVAEYWYTVEDKEPSQIYGFTSPLRIKCAIFAPEKGDTLYPYFDDAGDLIAFSRQYTIARGQESHTYFETYTAEATYKWDISGKDNALVEGYPKPNPIGKIPVIYAEQPDVEWADVQNLIERLETLLSNFADTNDYHASPKILVTGEILDWAKKGESGAVIQMSDGGSAQYLTWSQAPASVKTEIDTLLQLIYTISQTPDISFENVKTLGGVSGVALDLLFMDSNLKVKDKRGIFDEYLQRRINVVKAYLQNMNLAPEFVANCKNTIVKAIIKPFRLADKTTALNQIVTAYNNHTISERTAVTQTAQTLGTGVNVEEELDQIHEQLDNIDQTDLMVGGI